MSHNAPTTTRDTILRAADFIEANPDRYVFEVMAVPSTPGGVGCAVGWIGFFAGVSAGCPVIYVAKDVLGFRHDGEFYQQLNDRLGTPKWSSEPHLAADGLRAVADQFS